MARVAASSTHAGVPMFIIADARFPFYTCVHNATDAHASTIPIISIVDGRGYDIEILCLLNQEKVDG